MELELTARENPAYPATSETSYWIGGTHGSFSLPGLRLWHDPGERSWCEPTSATQLVSGFDDPLQFGRVVRGEEPPRASRCDVLYAFCVAEAIKTAAASGESIDPRKFMNLGS